MKEKLIDLLGDIQRSGTSYDDYEIYGMRIPDTVDNESVADHLIANGVTIQNWIPVTERLPKTDGRFMVTIKGKSGKPHVEMRNFHAGNQKWESQLGWGEENVLAWQARPRPYGWKPKEG